MWKTNEVNGEKSGSRCPSCKIISDKEYESKLEYEHGSKVVDATSRCSQTPLKVGFKPKIVMTFDFLPKPVNQKMSFMDSYFDLIGMGWFIYQRGKRNIEVAKEQAAPKIAGSDVWTGSKPINSMNLMKMPTRNGDLLSRILKIKLR